MFFYFARFFTTIFTRIFWRVRVTGKENVPKDGRLIVCANHNTNLDPLFVASVIKRQTHFMAKKELFNGKFWTWIFTQLGCIPVNRDGNDLVSLKMSMKLLSKERILGIFPEGRRKLANESQPAFKPGAVLLAIRTKTPVLPIHIVGTYKLFSVIDIRIGCPVPFEKYEGIKLTNEEYAKIANEEIASRVLEL